MVSEIREFRGCSAILYFSAAFKRTLTRPVDCRGGEAQHGEPGLGVAQRELIGKILCEALHLWVVVGHGARPVEAEHNVERIGAGGGRALRRRVPDSRD